MALHDFVDWKYPQAKGGIQVPTAVCSHGCSASACRPTCSPSCGGAGCGMSFSGQKTRFGGKNRKK